MHAVSIGVDVGGTKTHVAVIDVENSRRDHIVPSSLWRTGALFDDAENFTRLIALILTIARVDENTSLVFGMHGCDNAAQRVAAKALLSQRVRGRVHAINDAALLAPASGVGVCIQLIVGTGTVMLGETADGEHLSVEGYGWLLGDHGSAPALVRDAMRLLVRRADRTVRGDPFADPFARELAKVYGARDVTELALAFTVGASATTWGAHAALLFDSAAQGSVIANDTIDAAAATLAEGVVALVRRGAIGTTIVAAGGVIVNQPRLQSGLRAELARVAPAHELIVLTAPPVDGALALAAGLRDQL
ncbi:MAG: BadF/BadG/BcrA/BcrD ATPase family protein [Microcella sp.]|nr:BadF/BadG/BcrA/BcrD ATPase family protein [Microcella sp.]